MNRGDGMIYKNLDIVLEDKIVYNGFIELEHGRIKAFGDQTDQEGEDMNGLTVMGGFIDVHMHGTDNDDFMDANPEAVARISENILREGTTSFLATTMTMGVDAIERALRAIAKAPVTGAKLQGVHLEGPFINAAYKGAQNDKHIIKGTPGLLARFQEACGDRIKIVTLAPETQDETFIEHLVDNGIIVSFGHSGANSEEFKQAHALGVKRVTHCFNAMPQMHHRELSMTGMALLYDDVMTEAIVDFIHLAPDTVALLDKIKPESKLTLITDAIRAKNLKDGSYDLGGQAVKLENGIARTEEGAIAGSTLHMNQAVKNMKEATENNLVKLSKQASLNPARELGIDQETGSIKEGKAADLVFLDRDFNVRMTMVDGEVKYENN